MLTASAKAAGKRAVELVGENLRPSDILTMKAFENAIMVHAAIAGSTNALLHLPSIAYELGLEIKPELFDEINRRIPYLLNVKPSGKYPVEYFYAAGGVPAIMEELRDFLHLDAMTVTGKTVGENLDALAAGDYYKEHEAYYEGSGVEKSQVLFTVEHPLNEEGSIAIFKGNIALEGSVMKHSAVPDEMKEAVLYARPFDCEGRSDREHSARRHPQGRGGHHPLRRSARLWHAGDVYDDRGDRFGFWSYPVRSP